MPKKPMGLFKAEREHLENLERKVQRLRGLQALLQEYEEQGILPRDDPYVNELSKKIHRTQTQVKAMGGL